MSENPLPGLLNALRVTHRELLAEWSAFTPDDFDRSSACAGWTVRDVLAHLRLLSSRYPNGVVQGLNGIVTEFWMYPLPGEDYETADSREFAEARGRPGYSLATEFAAAAGIFVELMDRLSPEDLEKSAGTPRGTYKIRHFPFFYIYELGIHDWDIRAAFDPNAPIRPALAPAFGRILRSRLPTLVQGPVPAEFPAQYSVAIEGEIADRWTVSRANESIRVGGGSGNGAPHLTTDLTGLALVTGGRLTAAHALASGRWKTNDSPTALRFGHLFAGPG